MINFSVRKEFFGGILSDLRNFSVSSINNLQYELLEMQYTNNKNLEYEIVSNSQIDNKSLTAPISVTIYPSLECNADCSFCFVKPLKGIYKEKMEFNKFCKAVDNIKDSGVFDIEIMGGEPFLIPWMVDGIKYIIDKNIHCSINTNGLVLNSNIIDKLEELEKFSFRISIQAPLDNSSKSRKIIEYISNKKIKYDVLTVFNKNTFKFLPGMFKEIANKNIKNIIVLYENPIDGLQPKYTSEFFYNQINQMKISIEKSIEPTKIIAKGPFNHKNKERIYNDRFMELLDGYCIAGISRIEIMPNGDVYPCIKYFCKDEYLLGNVFSSKVSNIFKNEKTNNFRKIIYDYSNKNNCNCKWSNHCSGCVGFSKENKLVFDNRCPGKISERSNRDEICV